MEPKRRDYSIFEKFNFEMKSVGVSYSLNKPDGFRLLDKDLALCEQIREAQISKPFYVGRQNIQCGNGMGASLV